MHACVCVCVSTNMDHGTCVHMSTCVHVSLCACVCSVLCGLCNPNYAYGVEPGCNVSENADTAFKLHFIAINQLWLVCYKLFQANMVW